MRESGMKCNFAINTFSSPSRPIVKIPSWIKPGAVFAPSFRHVLFSRSREIEGKCGPRSLDRIWSKEQRWQDHIFLGRLFIWCRDKTRIMSPSVIGWKTAQLLNKVGSNEDLYWLAVFDSRWHKLREQRLHDFMIISGFSWHYGAVPW